MTETQLKVIEEMLDAREGPVHIENRQRLEKILERRGRRYTLTAMHDDVSEEWLWLKVEERK